MSDRPVIVVGAYMARHPLGGNLSCFLQWLVGLNRLGCEVVLVENANYANACFDPITRTVSDNPGAGLRSLCSLLQPHGLAKRICFIDVEGRHHGMSEAELEAAFSCADAFVDLGTHGSLLDRLPHGCTRVLVDGEPGFRQIAWEAQANEGRERPVYDHYFTNGGCVGKAGYDGPLCGEDWIPVWNPVVLDLFPVTPPSAVAAFTTVMNWQAHKIIRWRGREYGQKDVEFAAFMGLPRRCRSACEVAVSRGGAGGEVPLKDLAENGWRITDAVEISLTVDRYLGYIRDSLGEFSVCKHVFRATRSGWFSDRSAAYLASGRPVVLLDTGFSKLLPTGLGLYAVNDVAEAADAMDAILENPERESTAAREIAAAHLAHDVVLPSFLSKIGLG